RAAVFGRHGAVGDLQFVADRAGRGDLPCYAVADRAPDQPAGAAGRRGGRRGGPWAEGFGLGAPRRGRAPRRAAGRGGGGPAPVCSLRAKTQKRDPRGVPRLRLTPFSPGGKMMDQREVDAWFDGGRRSAAPRPLFEQAADDRIGLSFGFAELTADGHHFNTSILVDGDGKIVGKYRKVHLPGHSEFDPERAFQHLEKRY